MTTRDLFVFTGWWRHYCHNHNNHTPQQPRLWLLRCKPSGEGGENPPRQHGSLRSFGLL